MKSVLVSVLISVYNSEKYVEQAIRSIMNQTYKNLEILIADDCSKDSSFEILQKLAKEDSRVQLIRNEKNLKLAKSLNKLIKLAKGKYVARMDSDDIALPERIEKQVKFLEQNPGIDFCGTNAIWINEHNRKLGNSIVPITNSDCKYFFRYGNPFIHPSVMLKISVLKENLYSESFKYAQDYELWGRLLFKLHIIGCNIPDRLMLYRISSIQSSSSHREEQSRLAASVLDLYEIMEMEKEDLELHKSLFFDMKWKRLTFSSLCLNLAYIKKSRTKYSTIIYVKLLKMSVKKINPFMILYCLISFPKLFIAYSVL